MTYDQRPGYGGQDPHPVPEYPRTGEHPYQRGQHPYDPRETRTDQRAYRPPAPAPFQPPAGPPPMNRERNKTMMVIAWPSYMNGWAKLMLTPHLRVRRGLAALRGEAGLMWVLEV